MLDKKNKIVFFGGGKFAAPSLNKLAVEFDIALVITNPEKPIGRHQIPEPSAVEIEAKKLNLAFINVKKFDSDIIEKIKNLQPDFFVVVDYGKIIPQNILDIPPRGAINIHPSKLPLYRGASPIQTAILNGDKETAISIMLIDTEIDHGPILAQTPVPIAPDDTYGSLYEKISYIYPDFLIETLKKYLAGEITPQEQKHDEATFTKLLKKDDGKIDWTKTPAEIERMVRAYNPWPGTWTEVGSKRVKILKARIEGEKLIIEEVQPEGKKPMKYEEYLKGNKPINE